MDASEKVNPRAPEQNCSGARSNRKFYYEATFGVMTQKPLDPKVLIASAQWKLDSALGFPQIQRT